MKLGVVPGVLALVLAVAGAAAADPPAPPLTAAEVRQACAADFQKYCPNLQPGEGAARACIRGHFMSFTHPCRHALMTMRSQMQHQNGGATQPAS